MGISPFKSRFDLLLEKAELKDNDFDGNEYTEYGNVMEPKIREHINKSLGKDYKEGNTLLMILGFIQMVSVVVPFWKLRLHLKYMKL